MINFTDYIIFIQKNSMYFKKFKIDVPIFEKDYEFDIGSITSKHIKLQYKFTYDDLFYSKEDSIEYLIKNLIIDDERAVISSSQVLSQRARNKRNLRGASFLVPVWNFNETFAIKGFSHEFVTIEKSVEYNDLENMDEKSLDNVVMLQLFSFKDAVGSQADLKEQERLEKYLSRLEKLDEMGDKNTEYTETSLMNTALYNKFRLKKTSYPTMVHDKVCSFDIIGVGPQAVKLAKSFNIFDIYFAESNSIEGDIKHLIDDVLKGDYENIDDFKREIDRNYFDSNINIMIGDEFKKFRIYICPNEVELRTYVRYEHMMGKFIQQKSCMETGLKRFIENY